MDLNPVVFEVLLDQIGQAWPLLLLTTVLASVMGAVASVRNEPTWWRDFPGGVFWGWLAGIAAVVGSVIASSFIEEFIRKVYDYKNWQVLQIYAFCIFGPMCLFASYWVSGWWFRRKIKERRLRLAQGLPLLPWYAISLRTLLLLQLGVLLAVGGWYSTNRDSIRFIHEMKQRRAWQETVYARFNGYGWNLQDPWQPLSLLAGGPLVGFNDQVLEKLVPADQLRFLTIHSDQLTNKGLRIIAEQGNLEILSIKSANISDEGLIHLARLPKLNTLTLNCQSLTDAALVELQKCPALKSVDITQPRISREAFAAYQAAKPEVRIYVIHPWLPPKNALPQPAAEQE